MAAPACPTEAEVLAFLDERLDVETARVVDEHLQRCGRCHDTVEGSLRDAAAEIRSALSWFEVRDAMPRSLRSAANTPAEDGSPGFLDPGEPTPGDRTMPSPPDGYRILRLLGAGTFGEVWLAEDCALSRAVALKTIHAHLDTERQGRDLDALRGDARLLASLRHPHIVPVYAWIRQGKTDFLAMAYIPGGSLADRMRLAGQPLPWVEAARYIAEVAEGVVHLHERGVVHRDIKPGNILWDPERDEAILSDFGVAARLADDPGVAGTPGYMAPEVLDGRVSPAQDVYALAASLFRLITGERPFPARNVGELRSVLARGLPDPDPRCRHVPGPLERIIRAGLTATPERRPAANEFAASLRGALNQLLADRLPMSAPARDPVELRLLISRQVDRDNFVPLAASHPPAERQVRDMKAVPAPPESVTLRTGDRVRIEVVASRAGHVTVYNVGPTGNLNSLYPLSSGRTPIEPGRPLHVLDVEMTSPTGVERLFAVWSREPLSLRLDEVHSLVAPGGAAALAPYRATRDMVRIQEAVRRLDPEDWCVAVLEVEHRAG